MLRQGLLVKQRLRSLQNKLFHPPEKQNPLLPSGTRRTFSLSLSFHLSFPSLYLVKCRLEQIFEDTKDPFTVAI